MNEQAFIAQLRSMANAPAARGLADDAAVFGDLVLTHDMMVAGTHFLADADPADVAWKLVATNLSDLAAKGAMPLGVLLGYMLSDDAWDRAFAAGLADALSHFSTPLWGGDTVAAAADRPGPRAFGLTAIGRASVTPVPSRAGAEAGERLWMTGTLGLALAGYRHDAQGLPASDAAIARFRRPVPRLAEGAALAGQVTAMMDISDGLLLDASRLASASGVTIALETATVPVAADLSLADRAGALSWGDDYELLFTLPADAVPPVAATCIGRLHPAGPDALLIDGQPPAPGAPLGWEHRPRSVRAR